MNYDWGYFASKPISSEKKTMWIQTPTGFNPIFESPHHLNDVVSKEPVRDVRQDEHNGSIHLICPDYSGSRSLRYSGNHRFEEIE